jgi:N-acetylglutamate synthase-like GNAT family acetyltransferase
MNPQALRVRRATTDDLPNLKSLWLEMRLPADTLEKRLTEFQVVHANGIFMGAIGIQFFRQHALLHNEGFTDFSIADAARQLFWERIQILAANHGVFRLWTQERSPFWKQFGFQPPQAETLAHLPEQWKNEFDGAWLTLQLKDEEVIATALGKNFAGFMDSEKRETERVRKKAKTIRNVVTIVCFGIFFVCIAVLIYLLARGNPFRR